MKTGKISSIETFGTVDGPGIRYVLFLRYCPLRCIYCHNPETWAPECHAKYEWTSDEVIANVLKYKDFHGSQANITISGGEPLVQYDFLLELVKKCKKHNIHVCIDTSGSTFINNNDYRKKIIELNQYVDLWMIDLKHIDDQKHQILTGKTNQNILQFIKFIDEIGNEIWIKYVLVPGFSDDENDLKNTRKFLDSLTKLTKVEVLPFHKTGEVKYTNLNMDSPSKNIKEPNANLVSLAEKILIK